MSNLPMGFDDKEPEQPYMVQIIFGDNEPQIVSFKEYEEMEAHDFPLGEFEGHGGNNGGIDVLESWTLKEWITEQKANKENDENI